MLGTPVVRFLTKNFATALWFSNAYLKYRFSQMPVERIFAAIYRENAWLNHETRSGDGSTIAQTTDLVRALPKLLRSYGVKSMLDLPCGDLNWMRNLDLSGIDYRGGDIVDELVQSNQRLYGTEGRSFRKSDLISDALDPADLILVRDCFVHLSFDQIFRALANISRTRIKYLLVTSHRGCTRNLDVTAGCWRPLNLQEPPFNFPEPVDYIEEKGPLRYGKILGLWPVARLPPPIRRSDFAFGPELR